MTNNCFIIFLKGKKELFAVLVQKHTYTYTQRDFKSGRAGKTLSHAVSVSCIIKQTLTGNQLLAKCGQQTLNVIL